MAGVSCTLALAGGWSADASFAWKYNQNRYKCCSIYKGTFPCYEYYTRPFYLLMMQLFNDFKSLFQSYIQQKVQKRKLY